MKTNTMRQYNFEIYTKCPETGETGWEIEFRNVTAQSKERAIEMLESSPNFDCIILSNGSRPSPIDREACWDNSPSLWKILFSEPSAPFLTFKGI